MTEVMKREEQTRTETKAMIVQQDMTIDATEEQETMTTGIETVSIIAEEKGTTKEIGVIVETLKDKKEEDLTIEDPMGQVEQVEAMVEALVKQEGLEGIPQWLTHDPVSPF